MPRSPAQKRIWGWMMFDWASQPYNTLLLTFIFGPYFSEVLSDRYVREGMTEELANAAAQSVWGWGLALSGLAIAIMAPVLGAIADSAGRKMPYILVFSLLYVVGSGALWFATPDASNATLMLGFFAVGLVGMEFATAFTNALLPRLGPRSEVGFISGKGFSLGYAGGLIALIVMLLLLAENKGGVTLLDQPPILGLDSSEREGTRSVGPLTALWYVVFMVPFFLWVPMLEKRGPAQKGAVASGLRDLARTIRALPKTPSLANFLAASMFYRDALNGMYIFGGVYAIGVLGWTVVDTGTFGVIAVISGAVFAYLGGRADRRFGPKPVIFASVLVLIAASSGIVSISRDAVFLISVAEGSSFPDYAFYFCGACVGAAGGTLQSASRTMLVRQANPDRMTEAFGLYAMAGKATAFLAPALIGLVTAISDSQRVGVTPILGLFLLGLLLLIWVKPNGEDEDKWAFEQS